MNIRKVAIAYKDGIITNLRNKRRKQLNKLKNQLNAIKESIACKDIITNWIRRVHYNSIISSCRNSFQKGNSCVGDKTH